MMLDIIFQRWSHLEAVYKRRSAQQNRKNWFAWPKMFALAQHPPLSVRTHHKYRNIRSFLHQIVRTSAIWKNLPPWPQISALDKHLPLDCGRLLWTAPYLLHALTYTETSIMKRFIWWWKTIFWKLFSFI